MLLHQGYSNHPEKPVRLSIIWSYLEEVSLDAICPLIKGRTATTTELQRVHKKDYLDILQQYCSNYQPNTAFPSQYGSGIYFNEHTWSCASFAAGSLCEMTKQVLSDDSLRNGMALIRPPGHHALSNFANGFCYLNNVAMAAAMAVEEFHLERVLIIDFDVHHGNGTQALFYESNQVMYFSAHRWEEFFFPKTGKIEEIGEGKGKGYNINVPLTGFAYREEDLYYIFVHVLRKLIQQFSPELILVSAGYDAVKQDPIGKMNVSIQGFETLTQLILFFANECMTTPKVIYALEGGYNVTQIAECVMASMKALVLYSHSVCSQEEVDSFYDTSKVSPITITTCQQVAHVLEGIWKL